MAERAAVAAGAGPAPGAYFWLSNVQRLPPTMKQALEEATRPDVTVKHPHQDPHGIQDVLQSFLIALKTGRLVKRII